MINKKLTTYFINSQTIDIKVKSPERMRFCVKDDVDKSRK